MYRDLQIMFDQLFWDEDEFRSKWINEHSNLKKIAEVLLGESLIAGREAIEECKEWVAANASQSKAKWEKEKINAVLF